MNRFQVLEIISLKCDRKRMSSRNYNLYFCPFCAANVTEGGRAWLIRSQKHKSYYRIACSCGAFGPEKDSKEKAIMAWWNRSNYSGREFLWNPFDIQKDTNKLDLKGNLKSINFTCIIQILSSEGKTGILQLSNGRKTGALYLKDGQVLAASNNYGQKLGQIISDKKFVSEEGLQKAFDKAKESGKKLGEMLLDLGYISMDTLRSVIRQQISETIQGLILWEEGSFKYRDCTIEFDEKGIENISIMEIMLDALRISDEVADTQAVKAASSHESIWDLEASIGICED